MSRACRTHTGRQTLNGKDPWIDNSTDGTKINFKEEWCGINSTGSGKNIVAEFVITIINHPNTFSKRWVHS
jgi:hypothetical protein